MNTELCTVRHRTASGCLERFWEFVDEGERPPRILASIRLGSARPVLLDVPVCTNRHPRVGCWIVVPVDSATWRLTPTVWCGKDQIGDRAPHTHGLPLGSVVLSDAPEHVSEALRNIGGESA